MFGFLAALSVLAIGVAALLHRARRPRGDRRRAPSADLPNGAMVERFNSYLYRMRARPARARAGRDRRDQRRSCRRCKQTLERVETLDPGRAGRAAPDVDPSARPDRPLSCTCPPPSAASRTAKARRSTSAWSRGWRPAARRLREISRAAGPRRRGRARNAGPLHQVALRRASGSKARTRQALGRLATNALRAAPPPLMIATGVNAAGADGDAACLAQCRSGR